MEQAIKRAIEGGWKPQEYGYSPSTGVSLLGVTVFGERVEISVEKKAKDWDYRHPYVGDKNGTFWVHQTQVLSDPLFWQALGKAEGWKKWRCDCGHYFDKQGLIQCEACNKVGHHESWKRNWHRFIDHLAEGGDAESFFKELLK